jgi:hypothetical protein
MSVRASRSSGSSAAFGSASKISRAACTQKASVYGEAKIDTTASSAWVRASTLLSTVTERGIDTAGRGSTTATSGTRE